MGYPDYTIGAGRKRCTKGLISIEYRERILGKAKDRKGPTRMDTWQLVALIAVIGIALWFMKAMSDKWRDK
ncbi:hypothetical protein GCM10027018_05360 [Paenibacillus thermoaerophilus]